MALAYCAKTYTVPTPIRRVQRALEALDRAAALQFGGLNPGEPVIYQSAADAEFAVVASTQPFPLTQAQAEPRIRDLRSTQAKRGWRDRGGARLRSAANLVYARGFATGALAGA